MKDISIVVPVYNSAATLRELVTRLSSTLQTIGTFEIILVNDGSHDESEDVLHEIAASHPDIKVVSFFKNYGQINALMAGLREVEGQICVILDDDLQNPPEEIPKLIAGLNKKVDFVFGVSEEARHSLPRRFASWLVTKIANVIFEKPKGFSHSSFLALKREVVEQLVRYDGPHPYLAGLLFRVTHRGSNVIVDRADRKHGRSQYSLLKLIRLWVSSLTNFSILPLRIAAFSGAAIAFTGFAVLAILLVRKYMYGAFLSGWISTIGIILIFNGAQLLASGIIGEYIGRSFMILNRTPQYAIREKLNCREKENRG